MAFTAVAQTYRRPVRATRPAERRSNCPISVALEMLGDGWTLLVVRDLMFKGLCRFNEFLAAGEGIASNVLADRLARLEAHGIVTKNADPADARRYTYRPGRERPRSRSDARGARAVVSSLRAHGRACHDRARDADATPAVSPAGPTRLDESWRLTRSAGLTWARG
jgi:DNA-binding HxlR family transcriptional regulator